MIEVRGLSHSFGEICALDNVSFQVHPAEVVSILGPNGAGKTTLLNILAGILLPDKGEVFLNGIDVLKNPYQAKKITAYIPEQPYLWGKLTGLEFLLFIKKVYKSEIGIEKIGEIMKEFDIYDYRNSLIETYSHGIRQKLLFLTIPIINPKVILLDEPLVGLDPKATIKVIDLIKEFSQKQSSVFISTHIVSFAEKVSSKVLIIDEGKIILEGNISEIKQKHASTLEEIFLKETQKNE
ncbi:MAG: ABC transporter ATP-binding protein [Elusimicrobia bacterium]|nr:ABC transporter ATP-binding protein [Elusimicrobiota bacterium]